MKLMYQQEVFSCKCVKIFPFVCPLLLPLGALEHFAQSSSGPACVLTVFKNVLSQWMGVFNQMT